jgi:hypothetical protein
MGGRTSTSLQKYHRDPRFMVANWSLDATNRASRHFPRYPTKLFGLRPAPARALALRQLVPSDRSHAGPLPCAGAAGGITRSAAAMAMADSRNVM